MSPNPKDDILSAILSADAIIVGMHVAPDGDTAGSALALTLGIQALGRNVRMVSRDPLPERLAFLPGSSLWETFDTVRREDGDLFIAVDCGNRHRLGAPEGFWSQPIPIINIDHHQNNPHFGTINWVDSTKSSTGEMIADLIRYAQWELSPDQAVALYTAISTDTLSFRQVNTSRHTLAVAEWLLTTGIDVGEVNRQIWDMRPVEELRFLGWALSTAELLASGRVMALEVSRSHMSRFGVDDAAVDMIVHHFLTIDSVRIAILVKETDQHNQMKVSWRGKRGCDVAVMAQAFGGGGHAYAAAAQVSGTLHQVREAVVEAVAWKS